MITQSDLKQTVHYDPESGIFHWLTSPNRKIKVGDIAGCVNSAGYIAIQIDKKLYYAHRLAWFYVHGAWPPEQIDHINMCKSDNRLANLRCVTVQQNQFNKPSYKGSTSKYVGVCFNKAVNKFMAGIQINGKQKHLGYYAAEEQAYSAYLNAKNNLHIIE